MKQVTFKISDLQSLIENKTGNVLITIPPTGRPTATIVASAGTVSAMDATDPGTIDGCPYPSGCTN